MNRLTKFLVGLVGFAASVWVIVRSIELVRDEAGLARIVGAAVGWFSPDAAAAITAAGPTPLIVKVVGGAFALVVGVLGVWALFFAANWMVDALGRFSERVRPMVFVVPALLLLGIYLIYPLFSTTWTSFSEGVVDFPQQIPAELADDRDALRVLADESERVAFSRYWIELPGVQVATVDVPAGRNTPERHVLLIRSGDGVSTLGFLHYNSLGDPEMRIAIRNNLLWLFFVTSGSLVIGLVFAALVDRIRREAFAKTFIFMPLAISAVGASVIWGFMYNWQPAGRQQIGLLNAIWVALGNDAVPWLQQPPINTFALIAVMIWLQTGFAMVILSAAIKAVPTEMLEAARIDGAGELAIFWRIVIPSIKGSILTVATTIFIAVLKVFDIVYVSTGGRFETEVIANRMFTEMFRFRNFGRAAAIAVVLFLAVVPVMVVNVRNLRRQGVGS